MPRSGSRIFVLAPFESRTGGAEALHQLVDSIRTNEVEAFLVDPRSGAQNVPYDDYASYNAPRADISEINDDDVVVLPELWTQYAGEITARRTVIWWLSIDNAFGEVPGRWILPRLFEQTRNVAGTRIQEYRLISRLRRYPEILHATQSHYAFTRLTDWGFSPTMLTDYLSQQFLKHQDSGVDRTNPIAYNPSKGLAVTQSLLDAWDESLFTQIRDLDTEGVAELLRSSKIYLDLGPHPGRDRLPREAAAAGCVVFVSRRGSAANEIDVPLGDEYKVQCSESQVDVHDVRLRLAAILADFPFHQKAQEPFRMGITRQADEFHREVRALLHRIEE
jgi:hypothetical protein